MAQFWWWNNDRVLVDDQGRPKWGDSAEDCCCPEGCPDNCEKCPGAYVASVTDLVGDCAGLNGDHSMPRVGCIFHHDATQDPCILFSVTLSCSEVDGLWYLTIDGESCTPDNHEVVWQSDGRATVAGCPPTGVYVMHEVINTLCPGQVPTVNVS